MPDDIAEAMRWSVFSLILVVCAPLAAQDPIPDTTEAWRYFPLEIGNVWEYRVEIELVPPDCFPGCTQYWRRTVVGDSTIGEITYNKVLREIFNLSGEEVDSSHEYYRLDTLSATIYQLYGNTEYPYGGTNCGLHTPFPPEGQQVECGVGTYLTGEGYERVVEIADHVVATAVKSFYRYPTGNFRFGADIGLVRNVGCEGSCWDFQLIYANVNGLDIGTPFPVAVEPESPRSSGLSLTAHPNPSVDLVSISLLLSRPQYVAVEVFDLLGRHVYSEELVVVAGATTLNLDASGWPRGVYFVRITAADGETASTRITRL